MARHGYGRALVDTFIVLPQRSATCSKCGSRYTGHKEEVDCMGCGTRLQTADVRCNKKVPCGMWTVTTLRKAKPTDVKAEDGQARDTRETIPTQATPA